MSKTSLMKIMCSLIVLLGIGFLGAIPENEIVPFPITFAMKASPDGTVVVGNAGGGSMASYWTEETGVVNLGVGEAHDVSSNYLIAGTATLETDNGPVDTAGFWNLEGEFTDIGSFPGTVPTANGEFSDGMAISDDGTTIAGMGWVAGWVANALRWTEAGGIVNLHPSVENSSRVNALSADGSIAVGWVDDDWMRKPAYWDANNTLHMISDDMDGEALAISPDGQTILGTLEEEAFILRDGVITTFFMEGWGWSTIPTFITSDGLVTGILRNMMMNEQDGFVYTETMGIVLANDYFTSYGVELPEGYNIDAVSWVSEDHSTFVGWGGTDVSQGFIIKLVSPSQISGYIGVAAGDDVTLATVRSGQISTHPEADGSYVLTVAPGTHTLTITMPGYYTATSIAIEVDSGETVANIDFTLDEITDLATIQGTASIVEGQGNLTQAQISAGQFVANPNSDGEYQLLVEAGSYTLTASLAGFFAFEEEITMTAGEVLEADFGFVALDSFNDLVINVDGDDLDYANTRVFVNHNSWGDKYFTPTVDGSVALQLLYESDLTISVYAPGFVPASQSGIATSPYATTTVDFVMEKVYNAPRNLRSNTANLIEWDAPYTINSYVDNFESYNTGAHIAMNNPMWLPIGGDAGSIVDPIVALNPNVSDGKFLEVSADSDAIVNVGNLMLPGNSITTGKYEIDFDIMIPAGFAGHYNIIRSLENLEFSLEVFFREDGTLQLHHSADTFQTFTYNHDEWMSFKHVVDLTNDAASLHVNNEEVAMWIFSADAYEEGFGENKLDLINFSGDSEPSVAEVCKFYVDNFAFSEMDDFGADAYLVYRDDALVTPSPLSNLAFTDVALANGSYNYGVTALYDAVESDPANLVVVVDNTSNDNNNVNLVTRLQGNYPNPFNPETTISFSTQKDNLVTLDIYNIKGQRVKTLINEHKTAGQHSVVWNGTDDNNRNVSSGVYFYRMRNGEFSSTKKMILMK